MRKNGRVDTVIKCSHCENTFVRRYIYTHKRKSTNMFCSASCRGFYNAKIRGPRPRVSEETKKKMSEAHKKSGFNKGHLNFKKGAEHHNWRGGVTTQNETIRKSKEYKEWRNDVYKRDNFLCVLCGNGGSGNLHADHIKPFSLYPELRFDVSNGRTLCVSCHRKTDTYGFAFFNREIKYAGKNKKH